MQSAQPIVGKLPIDMLIEGKCIDEETTPAVTMDTSKKATESLEDMEGLRNMVEELRDALHTTEESMTKIRREKNDLAMKVKERDNKIFAMQQEHQRELANIQQQKRLSHQQQQDDDDQSHRLSGTPPAPSTVSDEPLSPSIPPPPPPPPPPIPPIPPSIDTMCATRRRKLRARSASRSSKYLHPLAMNLCFPTLKSLHENTVTSPTSPTSGLMPNVAIPNDAMIPGNPSLYPQTAMDESCLQQMSSITMKVKSPSSCFTQK